MKIIEILKDDFIIDKKIHQIRHDNKENDSHCSENYIK